MDADPEERPDDCKTLRRGISRRAGRCPQALPWRKFRGRY